MTTIGYLAASEKCSPIASLQATDFDMLIAVASWEERCRSIGGWDGLRAQHGLLLQFASEGEPDIAKIDNATFLLHTFETRTKERQFVELPPSTHMAEAFEVVGAYITEQALRHGRRLRICIDLTSMPRSLLCYLILMGFKEQIADSLTLFFAISDHMESVKLIQDGSAEAKAPLVEGKWELITVPYGEGRIGGERIDNMVLSLGFDTYQILDVIERVEPSSAIFLIPTRGDASMIDEVARKQLALLQQRFRLEFEIGRYEAMLVPPYGLTWVPELSRKLRGAGSGTGTLLLYPFGPKVHSIGLSLLALQREDAAVIGRIPTSYFRRSVASTGNAFVATLTDLSSPTSRANSAQLADNPSGLLQSGGNT